MVTFDERLAAAAALEGFTIAWMWRAARAPIRSRPPSPRRPARGISGSRAERGRLTAGADPGRTHLARRSAVTRVTTVTMVTMVTISEDARMTNRRLCPSKAPQHPGRPNLRAGVARIASSFTGVLTAVVLAAVVWLPSSASGQSTRAVRRTIPMTDMIRRAFAEGTRDSTGAPGPNYWQTRVDYSIDAALDPTTSTLTGSETATIHNDGPDEMPAIVMRLNQNIFRGDAPRAYPSVPAENTAGMVLTRASVDGQEVDLHPEMRDLRRRRGGMPSVSQPTLLNGTQTVAAILLPKPIPGRSTATLRVEWHYHLPGGPDGRGHRMTARWADSLYQVTQWFPRVAVFDDLNGWDTDLYLGPSEFYHDFGRFDVRLTVPAGWLVGATGVLQNPEEVLTPTVRERLSHVLDSDATRTIVGPDETGPGRATAAGDRLTWHFVADTANDFAWGTAKHFEWQATRATIPGKGPVPIYMLYLPGRASAYENAGPITRHALEFYSKLWIPYPFPVLTLLDGPDMGMEYPMVIMSNQGAADHETGHSWWPMMVSGDETRYGWMDEGFNQYMNILSAADRDGKVPDLDGRGQAYGRTSGNEMEPPMMWDANYAGPMYGFQTYSKTPLMLSMLGGIVGDTAVWRAQREYTRQWRFKHPSPWDWMFSMQRSLHRDLGWFWYYWLFTTASVDGSIQNVTTSGGRTTVTVREDGQMPSPVVLRVRLAGSGPPIRPPSDAVRVDDRTYDVTFPVDVWFGGSRTYDAVLDFGGRTVERVTFDPRGRFPDRDPADNVWPRG
jgi:hypothetical protein